MSIVIRLYGDELMKYIKPTIIGQSILIVVLVASIGFLVTTYTSDEKSEIQELKNDIEYTNFIEETHSKCGVGTVFEPNTYSCILKDVINPEEWCGLGTYYNATENACLLKITLDPKFNEHKV